MSTGPVTKSIVIVAGLQQASCGLCCQPANDGAHY